MLEAANIIPWEADPKTWQFTYVGSHAERMFGYPLDQWYEKDFWTSNICSEDRESAISFCETSSKTLSDFEFQYRMVKADGDMIWLRDIVSVEIENGVPQVLRGYMIDITAIKVMEQTLRDDRDRLAESLEAQSEELTDTIQRTEQAHFSLRESEEARARVTRSVQKLRDFLDAAPDATVITDEAGAIVFASTQLERLFGYRPNEVVGAKMELLLPKRLRRRHRGYFVKFFQKPHAREMGSGLELSALHKDGREFPVEVSLSPVQTENHLLISSAIRDISIRKAHQLRAEKRAGELEKANKALTVTESELRLQKKALRVLTGKLIAAQEDERRRIARELHDDLTQYIAIMAIDTGNLEQQLETTGTADIQELRKIRERLIELSEHVHTLSRQLHPTIVEDLGLAAALRTLCEELVQREGVLIDYQADLVPVDVPNSHSLCIYRVVQEALRNMVKHSQATQAQVYLRCKEDVLECEVSDNGIGFNLNEAKNQIGLGLQSMEERVWLVGGTVRVEAAPADGTVITASIPLP